MRIKVKIGSALVIAELSAAAASGKHLAALIQQNGSNHYYQLAQTLLQWRQPDEVMAAPEEAFDAGDTGLDRSRNDRLLDPIRHDGRFTAIQPQPGYFCAPDNRRGFS